MVDFVLFIEILATIMGVAMSLAYYPQAYTILKRRSARDISLISYTIFGFGTLTWLVYGLITQNTPIIASFSLGFVGSWLVLLLALKYQK